ncbi:MAG: ABC transporter permease [Alphaproteobacteria bacterium]|nr:ABC transporter permease [Alphaproteobacteria bacterium]
MARIAWGAYSGIIVLFMLTPLVLVVLFSFTDNALTNFPINAFSLHWYRILDANPEFWKAFENSLKVSLGVTLISTVIGTMAAMVLARWRERLANAALLALAAPVTLPALVIGIALLVFFNKVGVPLSLATVIAGHLVITQPFVILIVYARMVNFDYAAVDSARDLGASPWRAFWTVTFPIVSSTVIGAALIALAISLDDFIITFFTIGGGNTLPTFVWGKVRTYLDPSINAIGTILITLTVGSTAIALWISRYRG